MRILGITRIFADVLNLFFVYTAVSSPKPRDSLRGPPTSFLLIVVGKAVKGGSQRPRGMSLVCGRSLSGVWNCVFEFLRRPGWMLRVLCVVRYSPLCGADHSSRGVLPDVCVCVILKPR